jgi:hypothetical protein
MQLADVLRRPSGTEKVHAPRVGRSLSPDLLRRIFLEYYKLFWGNPINQMHVCSRYYAHNLACKWKAKLRVQRRGLSTPEFAITAEVSTWNSLKVMNDSRRVLVRGQGPLRVSDITYIVDFLVGTSQRGAHHRMDVIMVGGGQLLGEFGYERRMFSGDRSGPTAYMRRALLEWLRRQDVPVEAEAHAWDVVSGRNAGLGDSLPSSICFLT